MSANIFVDTNVLVYSRDAAKPEKQAKAAEWMAFLWETGAGRLSLQVLTEFYAVVTRKLKPGMEAASARQDAEDLFAWQPAPLTPDLIVEAWKLQDLFQLAWWDALIIAAAKQQGCMVILSEDFQHGQDFQGVRVMNPFRIRPVEFQSP